MKTKQTRINKLKSSDNFSPELNSVLHNKDVCIPYVIKHHAMKQYT